MATIRRFFTEHVGKEAILSGDEYSHAKNVLRLKEGDEVLLLDGSGKEYDAIINKVTKGEMLCTVVSERVSDKECKTKIRLLVGALKGDKTELVVQKATELGVAEIAVFSSRFCSAYMNENKTERLRKVAREAAKQCLRATVPTVEYFEKFEDTLDSCSGFENKLFACEFAQTSDRNLHELRGSCALVVGSEGGFSQEEFDLGKQKGFAGITLGKRILRAETAAIVFCGVVAFALGELE